MGLNLKATRKISLKEFAIGWDKCYLIVKTVSASESETIQDRLDEFKRLDDAKGMADTLTQFSIDNIVGGKILNTLDDGSTELIDFSGEDTPSVVDALNVAWQSEVLAVATGNDRLKLKTN